MSFMEARGPFFRFVEVIEVTMMFDSSEDVEGGLMATMFEVRCTSALDLFFESSCFFEVATWRMRRFAVMPMAKMIR